VQDINEVLKRKKAQLDVLEQQINQLQQAAEQLRNVAHLLQEDDNASSRAAGV
jgi:prefoldin subunit 5